MSIEKIKQMVNENWELIDESFVGAIINDNGLLYLQSTPIEGWGGEWVERPRVFEDGAFYPVVLKGVDMNDTARYSHPGFFYITSSNCSFEENEFSLIGEKLPDSLWGDQS